jgi:hypothetical protein
VWLIVLSDQLPVEALVGRYPTNKLIGREPIPKRKSLSSSDHAVGGGYPVLIQVSLGYPGLRGRLLTCYSPVRRSVIGLVTRTYSSLDLHALGTPPAFVLSQDQTLQHTFLGWPARLSRVGDARICRFSSSQFVSRSSRLGSRASAPVEREPGAHANCAPPPGLTVETHAVLSFGTLFSCQGALAPTEVSPVHAKCGGLVLWADR